MIINPMWFYWVEVIDKVSFTVTFVTIIAFILTVIGLFMWIVTDDAEYDEHIKKAGKKMFFIAGTIGVVCWIMVILIPSSTTMYKMMIAKYCTAENLQLGIESIQQAVDYIINAVAQIK